MGVYIYGSMICQNLEVKRLNGHTFIFAHWHLDMCAYMSECLFRVAAVGIA